MYTTKSFRWMLGLALLLIGVMTGIILTANMDWIYKGNASSIADGRARLEEKMAGIREFSEGFSAVAEYVTPSVVTVETEKKVFVNTMSPFSSPFDDFFGGDDMFRRFFGQPRTQPRQEQKLQGLGSGVIVTDDGYVLTNNHVVEKADKVTVTLSTGKAYEAKIVGADSRTDLAVLKIDDRGLPAVKISNSDQIKVGQWAIAIGNPFSKNLSQTVTAGIVSGIARSSVGLDTDVDFLQTDAAINPGNSGGALVNMNGELLGINTAILSKSGGYEGIGFAIPANTARSVMDQIIKTGKVVRGYVGIAMQDVDEEMAKALKLKSAKGAVITDVVKDSPAEKANLKQGDVIIEVDGKAVDGGSGIRKAVVRKAPGSAVQLKIIREGTEKEVTVTLAEAPDEQTVVKEEASAKKSSELVGIRVAGITSDLANKYGFSADEKGVVVTEVDQAGPAYRAGLRDGDVIKRIGKKEVRNLKDYSEGIASVNKGDTALFLINRRGSSMFIAFTIPNQ